MSQIHPSKSGDQASETPLIQWGPDYALGIPSIDEQHKGLIELMNRLHAAMERQEVKEKLGEILTALVRYTHNHFVQEEDLFEQTGYPSEAHEKQHHEMREMILSHMADYTAGKNVLTIELLSSLSDWLKEHIQGIDRGYVEYFKEKGVK